MATVTLTANTNYSALSVADGDTIALAGFRLTLDVVPSETGVNVTTVGTAGTVAFGPVTTYPLVGWTMTAGTTTLISTIASGVTVGANIIGGTGSNARGVTTNNGTITGSVYGTLDPAASSGTHGVTTNNGTISGPVFGGARSGVVGVAINNGTITGTVTGGPASNAAGVTTNNGTVSGPVAGGSEVGAFGISSNNGNCLGGFTNGVESAVRAFNGSVVFVHGPLSGIAFPATIKTLYSLFGPLSGSATVDPGAEVIELSSGGGGGGTTTHNPFRSRAFGGRQ